MIMREQIVSRENPLVKTAIRLASSASARIEEGMFLCEGPSLLPEALARGAEVAAVLYAEGAHGALFAAGGSPFPLPESTRLVELPQRLFAAVSTTETPQGLLFLCRLPTVVWQGFKKNGVYLVLDRIQDPGNVGSILRTAEGFSAAGVLLGPGCADPFSPKAVRASMGAVFGRFFYDFRSREADLFRVLETCGLPIVASVLDADADDLSSLDVSCAVLLLGNEGAGLSEPFLLRANKKVRIPMSPFCQSLGVASAATVFLWESFQPKKSLSFTWSLGAMPCPR